MLAQRRGCGSTRCRSTGSTTRTRASAILRTALDDLRGVARLMAAGPVARFMGVGVVSTLAYALLFLLLRPPLEPTAPTPLRWP